MEPKILLPYHKSLPRFSILSQINPIKTLNDVYYDPF
jgi:hypothetical protein